MRLDFAADTENHQSLDRGAIGHVEGYLRPIFLNVKDPLWVFLDHDMETGVDEFFGGGRC